MTPTDRLTAESGKANRVPRPNLTTPKMTSEIVAPMTLPLPPSVEKPPSTAAAMAYMW